MYGTANESVAIAQYEQTEGVTVQKCGLFVDTQHFFLAASPDGLVGNDGLVEVKCPHSARTMTPFDAASEIKDFCCSPSKTKITLKRGHNYYYQIQGQLHVTRKHWCDFVVWTPKGISIERIQRDDDFWCKKMELKLVRFYMKCLLPELADPCHPKGLPIREPQYILEAQKQHLKTKTKTDDCSKS